MSAPASPVQRILRIASICLVVVLTAEAARLFLVGQASFTPGVVIAIAWAAAIAWAVDRNGRKALWLLVTAPVALWVPLGLVWIFAACSFAYCDF